MLSNAIKIKYVNQIYKEYINLNLKNFENVEKLFLIEKNKKTYMQMSIPLFRGVEFSIAWKAVVDWVHCW